MFWIPPHRDAGQAPQVRHDKLGTFYETIQFGNLNFGHCDLFVICDLEFDIFMAKGVLGRSTSGKKKDELNFIAICNRRCKLLRIGAVIIDTYFDGVKQLSLAGKQHLFYVRKTCYQVLKTLSCCMSLNFYPGQSIGKYLVCLMDVYVDAHFFLGKFKN